MTRTYEKFDRWLLASIALHAAAVVVVFVAPSLFMAKTATWGSQTGGNGGVNVKIVNNVSGLALPAPPVTSDTAAPSENKSQYENEPAPKTAARAPEKTDPDAVKLPSKNAPKNLKQPVKPVPEPPTKIAGNVPSPKTAQAQTPTAIPPNAVPYGQGGGNPAIRYGQSASGSGPTGADFAGDGTFGQKYGTYVDAMTRAITEAWRGTGISEQRAPRVYVVFTIDHAGNVLNAALQENNNTISGPSSMERAALRAVKTAKLPPLPADYHGPDVAVRFYFDYAK